MNEKYLGDGLYASYDGWQFCLRAPRENGDHYVMLDPYTLAAFEKFCSTILKEMQQEHSQ
jgi:hypothetical protein